MSQPLVRARIVTLVLAGACAAAAGSAQSSRRGPLTVAGIMRGAALVGYPPSGVRWSGDSSALYFEWPHPGDAETSTWILKLFETNLRRRERSLR